MKISNQIDSFEQELSRKGYRKNSIENYCSCIALFLSSFNNKDSVKHVSEYDIKIFLSQFKEQNTQRSYHSAIKCFYKYVVKQPNKFKYIEYCKRNRKLPIVFSQEEIQRLFNVIQNRKHKAILSIMYSTGMRVGELLNIRLKDIDRSNMVIHIPDGKGGKQRQVTLKPSVLKLTEDYWREYKTIEFLFEGQFGGKYSERSINQFLRNYAIKAGINKRIYAHLIRHTVGTHLTEAGVNMGIIQRSFGHSSPKTTAIYQHISPNIISNMYSPIQSIRL